MRLARIADKVGIEPDLLAVRLSGPPLRFAAQVLLARWLPIASYGLYSVVSTTGDLAGNASLGGQPQATLRQLPAAHEKDRRVAAAFVARAWRLVAGLAILAGVVLASGPVANQLRVSDASVRVALVLMPLVAASVILHEAVLTATGRLLAAVIVPDVLRPLILLCVAGGLWASGVESVGAFLLVVSALLLAVVFFAARPSWAGPRAVPEAVARSTWNRTAFFGYFAALSLIIFYQSDVVIVGVVLGVEDAAVYAVSTRLAALATLPLLAVQTSVFAKLASQISGDRWHEVAQTVRGAQRTSFVLAAPIIVVLVAAGPLMLRLFGAEYRTGYWVMIFLLAGGVVNAATGPLPDLLWLAGRNQGHATLLGLHALINVMASVGAAHWWGLRAVAAATAIITVSWNVSSSFWARSILSTGQRKATSE